MFVWTRDMIRFYRRAADMTDYNHIMAELIVKEIGENRNIWDLGCGMSYLSLHMAQYSNRIDCVDVEEKVLDYLSAKAKKMDIDNLQVYNMDYRNYIFNQGGMGDCIIVSHFLNMKENLLPLLNSCKTLIIIKNNEGNRKWLKPRRKQTCQDVEDMIKKFNLKYKKIDYVKDFGQPLKSIEEAIEYNEIYTGKRLSREEMKEKLVKNDNIDYPYKLPKLKDIGIIIVER